MTLRTIKVKDVKLPEITLRIKEESRVKPGSCFFYYPDLSTDKLQVSSSFYNLLSQNLIRLLFPFWLPFWLVGWLVSDYKIYICSLF